MIILCDENPYTWKDSLYIEKGQGSNRQQMIYRRNGHVCQLHVLGVGIQGLILDSYLSDYKMRYWSSCWQAHHNSYNSWSWIHIHNCGWFGQPWKKTSWQLLTQRQIAPRRLLSWQFHMMTSSNGNIFRVTGHLCREFTGDRWISRTQRPLTRSFDVFFYLRLNKRFSKQSWGWWFEMLPHPLWHHSNDIKNVVCQLHLKS